MSNINQSANGEFKIPDGAPEAVFDPLLPPMTVGYREPEHVARDS
jgi:hypothetical protein